MIEEYGNCLEFVCRMSSRGNSRKNTRSNTHNVQSVSFEEYHSNKIRRSSLIGLTILPESDFPHLHDCAWSLVVIFDYTYISQKSQPKTDKGQHHHNIS